MKNGKAILYNYDFFHEDEVRARPTVQTNALKTALIVFGICHAHPKDYFWASELAASIPLFTKFDLDVDFKGAVFFKPAEVIAGDGFDRGYGGRYHKEDNE